MPMREMGQMLVIALPTGIVDAYLQTAACPLVALAQPVNYKIVS